MTKRAWAHLHLTRLRSGTTPNVISLKIPGQRIEYVAHAKLHDVEFKVHEAGRQRCIRENVRNVHAWVVGELTEVQFGGEVWRQAVYDPWKGGTFVDTETLEPVHTAYCAILIGKDVFYRPYADQIEEATA